ncbi:polyphosphate kinase 2 [Devosia epidermidihirudinis]|uniref:polyphosphate kinase 2 n=1 Tax=Devosia epidermidihirudinis TaxID=1293439 RepID=UPI000695EFB7|nr:polyphosphate kinase 2 [Devosia epidermidihirudinis]
MSDPFDDFDIDNPDLPKAIKKKAMGSGGYPYDDKLDWDVYEAQMLDLQKQLVLLQDHLSKSGERVMVVFEGRDAAGKGGTIKTYLENLNPRYNLIAALPKPNDRERTQWYFQRYVDWFPAAGETVLFDRSWYNRAGVEPVMGFCTPEQTAHFLDEVPSFEKHITNEGIHLFKFWLSIGREMQLKRFHDRRHDPLKVWKLSPIDLQALDKWDAYSAARDVMLDRTDSTHAPWTIIRANDKRRGRINVIQTVLDQLSFKGKDRDAIGEIDPKITLSAQHFMKLEKGD